MIVVHVKKGGVTAGKHTDSLESSRRISGKRVNVIEKQRREGGLKGEIGNEDESNRNQEMKSLGFCILEVDDQWVTPGIVINGN